MNFFLLFSKAVEAHAAKNLRPAVIDAKLERHLTDLLEPMGKAFFKPDKLDYTRNDVQLAYAFHYAPKHATIWQLHQRRRLAPFCGLRFNSIGTGPGSEVFGVVDAHRPPPGTVVEVCCHEENVSWTPLFSEAAALYKAATGVSIQRTEAPNLSDLWKGVPTIGSLILSEIVRTQDIHAWRRNLRDAVRPSPALFLDLPTYPGPGEKIYGLPELLGVWPWDNYVPKLNLDIVGRCNTDMAVPGVRCRKPLGAEPKMLFMGMPLS